MHRAVSKLASLPSWRGWLFFSITGFTVGLHDATGWPPGTASPSGVLGVVMGFAAGSLGLLLAWKRRPNGQNQ